MGRLAILGAGGHGRVVADSATELGWSVVFFDDKQTGRVGDWTVEGTSADLKRSIAAFEGFIVGIGNNRARLSWCRRLVDAGGNPVAVIDPTSRVSGRAKVAAGSFLAAGTVVNIGAEIGFASIVNTGASVDHDCQLGEAVHLSPGVHLSGDVTIGARSWLGTGCSVRDNIKIGFDVVAGVGSVIVKDVPDEIVVTGVPARPMQR